MTAYLSLFLTAFVAATLLPAASEGVLAGLVASGDYDFWGLWGVATLGNTLGSVVNYGLGRWCLHFQDRRWFPVKAAHLEKAHDRFQRWGSWSLLLAWAPLIGDPLTFAAGILRTYFPLFLLLVALGKGLRYAFVIFGTNFVIG